MMNRVPLPIYALVIVLSLFGGPCQAQTTEQTPPMWAQAAESDPIDKYDRENIYKPDQFERYLREAGVASMFKDYESAIEALTKAIELNPDIAFTYLRRAAALGLIGEYLQAIQDLDRAIELVPNSFTAYDSRGVRHQINWNRF